MSTKYLIASTLGICLMFGGLVAAKGAQMEHKDKKKDDKPTVTRSVDAGLLTTETKKKDDQKKDDKKSISASTTNHCFRLAEDSKKKDDKKKDDKPLLS